MSIRVVMALGYTTSELPERPKVFAPHGHPEAGRPFRERFGDWETVCWGEHGRMGRFPYAILLAWLQRAHVVFQLGSAQYADGSQEADWVFAEIRDRVLRLKTDFPDPFASLSESELSQWFRETATVITCGLHTADSIECSIPHLQRYRRRPDEEIFVDIVTSGNHAPRVMRDVGALKAGIVLETDKQPRKARYLPDRHMHLAVIDSDTLYGGGSMSDVKVFDLDPQKIGRW